MDDDMFGPAVVSAVEKGSPCEEAGVLAGDMIWEIDGELMRDLIDYYLLIADDVPHSFKLERDGKTLQVVVDSRGASPGIEMQEPVFGSLLTCDNNCIFCFVDQLPEGLKESVYVKDDDYRLSFLQGNFVTLTNLTDSGLERILEERLSPLYVSLHATRPALRSRLFGNAHAGRALENLMILIEGGIEIHIQIVLVRGVNDAEDLEMTLDDLQARYNGVSSIGVVPVGISRNGRKELPAGYGYDRDSSLEVISELERWGPAFGDAGPFAADEFFFLAGLDAPTADYYCDFPQTENGIGLARLFRDSFHDAAERRGFSVGGCEDTAIVTSPMGAWALEGLELGETGVSQVICENRLFGPRVTVCGLLPGADIAAALAGLQGTRHALIPSVAIGRDGDFIDGVSLESVARNTGVVISAIPDSGWALISALWERRDSSRGEP